MRWTRFHSTSQMRKIVPVDGDKPEAEVWKAVQAGLEEAGIKQLPK